MELEMVLKLLLAITGFLSVIIKIKDSTSQTIRKRRLKADLEFYEMLNSSGIDSDDKDRVTLRLKAIVCEYISIEEATVKWFDIFYALLLFIGFGWWTIYIYEINSEFSPYAILTGLISLTGLSLLIDTNRMKKKGEKVIFKIAILDEFKYAIIIILLAILIGFIVYTKQDGYSHWYIVVGVLMPIGLKLLADSIKFR